MKAVLVDDDTFSLELLNEFCQCSGRFEIVGTFHDPIQALEFAERHPIDLIMADIEMPAMNGVELVVRLREKNPKLVVVFTTSYAAEYLKDMENHADFFMMKPYNIQTVDKVLEKAFYLSKRSEKRLQVSMIGPFAVVLDGSVIKAKNAKARELLALCLDHRGGIVSREEAVDKLWPGREFDANTKKLVNKAENYIKKFFDVHQLHDFFYTTHAGCYIDTTYVECDYYEYVEQNGSDRVPERYLEDFEWANEILY